METWFIKIGKAWSILRRDGFVVGGQRVMAAFLALFRRVTPGDVLFITGGVGDSARYRTTHVAEMLRNHGFAVSVTVQDNPFLASYADQFEIFVFHRVLFTPAVKNLIERLKVQKKEIIFETDDLVYDPEFLQHMDYFRQMNSLERKLYEHGVGGEILADSAVTTCTTSTEFLARKLRERGKRAIVVPNMLSQEDLAWAEAARLEVAKSSDTVIRLAYFSGTPSHNKDFATIVPALEQILEKFPNVRLVLAGPLDTESSLQRFAHRVERITFAPRKKHFRNIASIDINLAPLEIGNPFCEAKSELKWFEAGIVGVPTVAAATEPFRQAITDGVDGFVAATETEWIEKLQRLITDRVLRQEMGEHARQTVLTRSTTQAANQEYVNYLKQHLPKHPAA